MIGPLLSEWYIVRPSAVHARPLETMRSSTIWCRLPSGSSRYSAAIGRDSCSSSIVPAQNRPSGETLPSLNRVPGTCSGPVKNVSAPVSKSSRWNPSTRATTAPPVSRSAKDPTRDGIGQLRFSPVAGSSRCMAGARMSIQYRTCSGTDHTGHSPSSARASSTQVTSVSVSSRSAPRAMSQTFSSVLILSSIRRWMSSAVSSQPKTQTVARPSKFDSRRVAKNSSQLTSPLPISLC